MTMYYAGIGSRKTPNDVLAVMTDAAKFLASKNFTLRSGGAEGADKAFEAGANKKEIFTTRDWINPKAYSIAKDHHPAWDACNNYVRMLHARNAMILLGSDLLTKVAFVLYWTPNGAAVGGTGLGLRIAKTYNIPIYQVQATVEWYNYLTTTIGMMDDVTSKTP